MNLIVKRNIALATAVMMASLFTACGEKVTNVNAANGSARVGVGETRQVLMDYTFNKDVATAEQAAVLSTIGVKYGVSDQSIASISEDGREITGIATGETSLTVEAGGSVFNVPLVVYEPIASLKINDVTISTADEFATPECSVFPQNAEGSVTYSIEDESIAIVSDDVIIPKAVGETTLYVTSDNGKIGSASVNVLQATTTISLTPETEKISVGETDKISVSGDEGAQAGLDNLKWESDNDEIATVDSDGVLTATGEGTVSITATNKYGIVGRTEVEIAAAPAVKPSTNNASGTKDTEKQSETGNNTGTQANASVNLSYGAVPLYLATNEYWWQIDSSDSAYWAVAENINAYRAAAGLPALTVSDSLSAIANTRCGQMLTDYSHNGMQTPGEIIGTGYNSAQSVCQAWHDSPGHYDQLANASWTQMGIACFFHKTGTTYWCVVFQ